MNYPSLASYALCTVLVTYIAEGTIFENVSPTNRWIGVYDDSTSYTWHEAEQYCNSAYGTSLASYHTASDELEVSNTRYLYAASAWIGLTDENNESGNGNGGLDDGWEWIDGSCFNYQVTWNVNEPNDVGSIGEDYVHLRGNADNLNDLPITSTLSSFVCNYVSFTNSDNALGGNYIGLYSVAGHVFTWDESETYCNDFFDTNLATTTSTSDEADASSARVSSTSDRAWVGLRNQVASIAIAQWTWSDGVTPYVSSQVSWAVGQPDFNSEQCVHFWEDSVAVDQYNNWYCYVHLREFICNAPTCNANPTPEPTPAPTDDPTAAPTAAPTWVAPCNNNPCDCGANGGYATEDFLCRICHSNGCDECEDVGTNFKLDYNYPCVNCQSIFGNGCLFCQDFNGCGQCAQGYNRVYDPQEDLFYCVLIPPTPEPTNNPTAPTNAPTHSACQVSIGSNCNSYHCTDPNENPNCANIEHWGCVSCDAGYFIKSRSVPCVDCSDIADCLSCSDWTGCNSCVNGKTPSWSNDCGFRICE